MIDRTRQRIIAMRKAGKTYKEIGDKIGVHYSTVRRQIVPTAEHPEPIKLEVGCLTDMPGGYGEVVELYATAGRAVVRDCFSGKLHHMSTQLVAPIPTPDEVVRMREEIKAGWSQEERDRRAVTKNGEVYA